MGQLIDASTGGHLWADRFEGRLEDVFDLQDQVATSIVGAIAPKLEYAEIERAKRKPTGSLGAYDYYLHGLAGLYQFTSREANAEALRQFKRAVELDLGFASAYGMAASCYVPRRANGWLVDAANEATEAARLARRALELGGDDALVLTGAGTALAYVARDPDAGASLIDRALLLNANLARAWFWGGYVELWLGEPDAASSVSRTSFDSVPSTPTCRSCKRRSPTLISMPAAMTQHPRGARSPSKALPFTTD